MIETGSKIRHLGLLGKIALCQHHVLGHGLAREGTVGSGRVQPPRECERHPPNTRHPRWMLKALVTAAASIVGAFMMGWDDRPPMSSQASASDAAGRGSSGATVGSSGDHRSNDLESLRASLYFHAPFDQSFDARLATHDRRLYTAPDLKRTESEAGQGRADVALLAGDGRHGDAVRFRGKSRKVLYYLGQNLKFKPQDWSGTVSLWLRLTPDEDLQTGYADPLQITDKAWNDASFFIDFDIDSPRTFRLGVFSEYAHWNPQNIAWDAWPVKDRPMIAVAKPTMTRDRWTHVAWTFSGINSADDSPSVCRLYIDGQMQGELKRPIRFNWNLDRTAIMLGLDYIGDLDELMLFDRALTAEEIGRLQTFFNE